MRKIIVYCEKIQNSVSSASLELISKAHDLKLKAEAEHNLEYSIEAVVSAFEIDQVLKQKLYSAGANKVVLIKTEENADFTTTVLSKMFVEYYNQNPSEIVLFPASEKIRTLAPRITTILETGLVADCTELDLIEKNDEIRLASTRPTFGGELMAVILSKKNPQCATVRPGTFKIKHIENAEGDFFVFKSIDYEEARLKLLRTLIEPEDKANLANAKIILCGGYGIVSAGEKDEYFNKLKKLAKILKANVGATRKVVDYGIVDSSYQIGQTGSTVAPELYVTFGVSGAIQHIIGMKNSKTIVAINSDENAEIFNHADYKIVADAKKVIDKLLDSVVLKK